MSPRSPASLSEGEVSSGDEEKAISTTTSRAADGRVNKSTRLPHGSSSRAPPLQGLSTDINFHFRDEDSDAPARGRHESLRDRSGSRSPYRANKAARIEKRRHEDDHYNHKSSSDPRRFKVHYEGDDSAADHKQRDRRRSINTDNSRHSRSRSREPYRAGPQTHGRDRSRSPYRRGKPETQQNGRRRESERSVDANKTAVEQSREQDDVKVKMSLSQHNKPSQIPGSTSR